MYKEIEEIRRRAGLNEDEVIPYDVSQAMLIAKQFYRQAGRNPEKAKKLATYFHQQILGNIDKHVKNISIRRINPKKT